jgi:hypothetical protein
LVISQQLKRELSELKFKRLSLDVTEGYDNYAGKTVRKARRKYDYTERIVIKKRRGDSYVGRSGRDDTGGRAV